MRSRSPEGVSPVRTQVRISTSGRPFFCERRANAGERRFQVPLDVVRQRLEWRDVDDPGLVRELIGQSLADEPVDRGEEGGKRLAGAGRCCDQDVIACLDGRPCLRLRFRRLREGGIEPGGHRRMKQGWSFH
jgi:hypothetical protein